jgi:hypothetical protein
LSELDEKDIMTKLRKANGANYDRQLSNYWSDRPFPCETVLRFIIFSLIALT